MVALVTFQASVDPAISPTFQNVSQLRFKNANNLGIDQNDPLVVPGAGFDFSFEKALLISVAGSFNSVSNLRLSLSSANPGTGIVQYYKFNQNYTQPIEPTATTGYTLLTNADVSWSNSGTLINESTRWGDYLYLMCTVDPSASTATQTNWNIIVKYDEI